MAVAVTIRNVPESVRDELAARAARAARSGRSLQEYLAAQLVELAPRPSVEEVVLRARQRALLAGRVLVAEDIVADRDADRR